MSVSLDMQFKGKDFGTARFIPRSFTISVEAGHTVAHGRGGPWVQGQRQELLRGLAAHLSDVGGTQVRGTRPEAGRDIVRHGSYVRIRIRSAEARHLGDSRRTRALHAG